MFSLDLDTITDDIEVDRFLQILYNAYKIKGSSQTRFCLTYSLTVVIYDGTGTLVIYIIEAKTLFI